MFILAADIGGTKSWLCLATHIQGQTDIIFEQRYPSATFSNATALLQHFINDSGINKLQLSSMCLALPGIVREQTAKLTNIDWELDTNTLQNTFSCNQVTFINDFEAAALGVQTLNKNDYTILHTGISDAESATGLKVVTGAGTGLGLAWLHYAHGCYHANATEGGHIDFAPTNSQQIALLKALSTEFAHVSYERLLSGSGLERIYRFISPSATHCSAAEISTRADKGETEAQQALSLFVHIYGAYVGNLALLYKPKAGIYLAGGIATKIQTWMHSTEFLNAYLNKGRMQALVKKIPLYLIHNERLGLQGALWQAIHPIKNHMLKKAR